MRRPSNRNPARVEQVRQRRAEAEILSEARCPVCRAPLIARIGRRGPYYFCLCAGKQHRGRKSGAEGLREGLKEAERIIFLMEDSVIDVTGVITDVDFLTRGR
jgi:hypothetical protein